MPAAYGISGLYNLKPLTETSINKALGLSLEAAERESPLFWPAPSRLIMDAVVGGAESDEYHRQSRRLVDPLQQPAPDAGALSGMVKRGHVRLG